jgi:hypothetical protein
MAMALVLNEVEDVEVLQRPVREEAVDSVLLIIEEIEGDGQFGRQRQLQMRPVQVCQRNLLPALRSGASPNTKVPSPVLSISATCLRFNYDIDLAGLMQ